MLNVFSDVTVAIPYNNLNCMLIIIMVFSVPPDALFGFLAYQFPYHLSLTATDVVALDSIFNLGEFFLKMAQSVHGLIKLLPEHVVMEMEKDELLWEPMSECVCKCMHANAEKC